jgi:hypothetical protein
MGLSLRAAALELVDAYTAAGLRARLVADPDRGPGLVVDMPSWDFEGRGARAGCGDLSPATLTAVVTVIGAGQAPEQIEALFDDVDTAREATPAPWRPEGGAEDFIAELPLYRITCTR